MSTSNDPITVYELHSRGVLKARSESFMHVGKELKQLLDAGLDGTITTRIVHPEPGDRTIRTVWVDGHKKAIAEYALDERCMDLLRAGYEVKVDPLQPQSEPQRHTPMERYVATVHLILPIANDQADASDQISAMLTDYLETDGYIEGWGYAKFGAHWLYPTKQVVRTPKQTEDSGDLLIY